MSKSVNLKIYDIRYATRDIGAMIIGISRPGPQKNKKNFDLTGPQFQGPNAAISNINFLSSDFPGNSVLSRHCDLPIFK